MLRASSGLNLAHRAMLQTCRMDGKQRVLFPSNVASWAVAGSEISELQWCWFRVSLNPLCPNLTIIKPQIKIVH